jgi:glycosyltransferase involved in cell wall biosynthesis
MSDLRRFAIVCPNFYPRVCGIGDHSARLGAELQRCGHAVSVYSRLPLERHPEEPGVEAHGVAGTLPIVISQRITSLVVDWRPTDVILQYTSQMWEAWRFGSLAMGLLAARVKHAGARVTLVAHEPFLPWSHRPDLLVAAATQRLHFAALLRSCDHMFVTTESRVRHVAPYCRAMRVPPPGVVRVGANALPIARAARPHWSASGGIGPRIGLFSTAAFGKRFDVVLDSFAQVAREVPSAELVLIGDLLGPSDRPAARGVKDALARHPARERIRVTGKLPLSMIASEIAALDVYLFPMNTGANTRSGTLPVALGSGVPAVAVSGAETDAGIFHDGENIVFARELSAPAFADATMRLLRDPELMARVGEGARRLYADHLSWERIADKLLAVA